MQTQLQMQVIAMNQGHAPVQMVAAAQESTNQDATQPVKLSDVAIINEDLLELLEKLSSIRHSSKRYDRSFAKKFKLLVSFKQHYGHIKVTTSMDKVLSSWVKNQRSNLGAMKQHLGPLIGRPFHVELLHAIGIYSYDEEEGSEED
jgi:hypothetical protein